MPNQAIILQKDDGYRGRDVAKPSGVTVRGYRDIASAGLEIAVEFTTYAWKDWDARRIDIVPLAALLTMRAGGRQSSLGWCRARPDSLLSPCKVDHRGELQFLVPLTYDQIDKLEELRSGAEVMLELTISVQVLITGDSTSFETTTVWLPAMKIADTEWTTALTSAGFDEHVWVDVQMPKGPGPGGAAERLRDALASRTRGRSDEAVAKCRLALDAVEQGGFAGRAPLDVHQWIMTNARKLTKRERVATLRAALSLLLSPAHHVEVPSEEFSRKDAAAAVALVAAVISLVEQLGPEPTRS
jgi:hypothetical protein